MVNAINDQEVTRRGRHIYVRRPKRVMTVEEALRQAAWLVTTAFNGNVDQVIQRFQHILQSVRSK